MVFASLVTGLLLSLLLGTIGIPYQVIFIIASLGITLLVEARGLFLTVASIPILFGIFTPLTAWFVSQQGPSGSAPGVSTTEILTAIYPLAQFFPTLILVTVIASIIAVLRIRLLRKNQQTLLSTEEKTRRAQREADQANANAARRARAQTTKVRSRRAQAPGSDGSQVTVDELIRKSQQRRQEVAQRQAARGVPFTPTPGPVVAPKPQVSPEPAPRVRPAPRPIPREQPQRLDTGERRQAPKRRGSLDDDLYS